MNALLFSIHGGTQKRLEGPRRQFFLEAGQKFTPTEHPSYGNRRYDSRERGTTVEEGGGTQAKKQLKRKP